MAKGVARLGQTNDEIVIELAWMVGRPVRFGGEFGGVKERAEYMAGSPRRRWRRWSRRRR